MCDHPPLPSEQGIPRATENIITPRHALILLIWNLSISIDTIASITDTELVSDAKEGAKQIIDNKYEEEIINEGYLHVKGYGISFYMKYCYIVKVQA